MKAYRRWSIAALVLVLAAGTGVLLVESSGGEARDEESATPTGETPGRAPPRVEEKTRHIASVPFSPDADAPDPKAENVPGEARLELHGRVIVTDHEGKEHDELDGTLDVVVRTIRSAVIPTVRKVEVRGGRFTLFVAAGSELGIHDARLGDRPVHVGVTRHTVPADGRLVIRGRWLSATRLRVRDARTGTELATVTVREAVGWRSEDQVHPGVPPAGRLVAENAASPLMIPRPDARRRETRIFWVGARGHAWTQARIPVGLDEQIVELEPGGNLQVSIVGERPPEGAVLRLFTGASGRLPRCESPVAERDDLLFEGLAPGRWKASVQKGEWYRKPLELARGEVDVTVGTVARLRLQLRSAESPEYVTVAGRLLLAEEWVGKELAIAFEPLEAAQVWGKRQVRISRAELTRQAREPAAFAWSTAELIPGPWQVIVEPMDHRFRLEVPAAGLQDLLVEIPPVADVFVTLRDADNNGPVDIDDLSWRGKLPKGVSGWSANQVQGDPKTGIFRFRAPAGFISIQAHPQGYEWLQHDTELQPGRNEIEILVRRSCGILLVVRKGGVPLPYDHGWDVQLEEIDGSGRATGWMSTGRISVSKPGRYRITMDTLPGFKPLDPPETTIPRGRFVTVTVDLEPID